MVPILLNLGLGVLKLICGNISGLASISADAANNLSDAVTALITEMGIKISSTLGGKRHENGHGRIEWLVGIVVSCSIILVGWEALQGAIDAIRHPKEACFNLLILLVMLISIGIKIFLYFFDIKKSKENNSSAYKAAAADCISDAVSTLVVTFSFLVNSLLHIDIDGWCGLLVSLFIMRNGLKSFAEISRRVLGEVENTDKAERIRNYVLNYQKEFIDGVADLQLLDYGYERYGAFLTVISRPNVDREKFLFLIADLKSGIYEEFGLIATIQPEIPAEISEQNRIKEIVNQRIKEIDEKLVVDKDMRVNKGAIRTQAVILINIPFEYSKYEKEIYQKIEKQLVGEDFSYIVKLTVGKVERLSRRYYK